MSPDPEAWQHLMDAGAAQLRSGFADEVLRIARGKHAPSYLNQFLLGAATAMLCFIAVALLQDNGSKGDSARILADWQQIASAADDSTMGHAQ